VVAQHSRLRETVDGDCAARIAVLIRAALAERDGSRYGLRRVIAVSFFAEDVATTGLTVVAVLAVATAGVVTGAFVTALDLPICAPPVPVTAAVLVPGIAAEIDVAFVAVGL
jgi:hypothetical protein